VSVIVLIGPSGAGKSTVANTLQYTYGFHLEKTITTRPQRDTFDTDHTFVSEETFQSMLDAKAFFGILEVFGHRYGLPKFNPEKPTILLLRAPAIKEFLTGFPDAYIIQIDAPIGILEARLVARGSLDRTDSKTLEQEIILGKSFASKSFDSSKHTPEAIAEAIAKLV